MTGAARSATLSAKVTAARERSVVIVSREPTERRQLARWLIEQGLDVRTSEDARSAALLLAARPADVVIVCALPAPETPDTWLDVATKSWVTDLPNATHRVLVVSAEAVDAAATFARSCNADVLCRPLHRALVELAACRAAAARKEPAKTDDFVATGRLMRHVVACAEAARTSLASVLVVGEPGSGKTTLAQRIADGAPTVDALREPSIVLAELRARLADLRSGSLLVEGVHALHRDAQELLLAHVARLPTAEPDARIRLVCTAEPAIRARVADGDFARQLYLALSGTLIELPPLRLRRDDIPVLLHLHLERARKLLGKARLRFAQRAITALVAHAWPGNLSELEATVMRSAAACRGEVIGPGDLLFDAALDEVRSTSEGLVLPGAWLDLPFAQAVGLARDRFARYYLASLLSAVNRNQSEAARRAGLHRANLRRALKRHGLL